jgi:hypothetical protein
MGFFVERNEIKKLLFFLILFFINIGFKEVFRVFGADNNLVQGVVIILTVVSIGFLLKSRLANIRIIFISLVFYFFLIR